ncbi:MAG TPA: MlaD family protein [Candidatus Acidoferrales bacterium]|nr:MlaD family protein [Candidatus Acidoferrales bacterium]
MNEKSHRLPRAKVEKSYLTWSLWLIPIGAAGLCGFFLLQDYVFGGPRLTIYFENADGLQEKNSMVKYLGIKVGEVESLTMDRDRARVKVAVELEPSAAGLARQGSKFWIVRPELKLGAVSGLGTIISGNYVTVAPGDGPATNTFTGFEQEPVVPIQSLKITLLTHDLDSLQQQSQIFYHGIQVGEVINFRFNPDASWIEVHARIRQEYAPLVRLNSRFWNAGGINVRVGLLRGLQVSAESAETIVAGGIAFVTPPDYGAPATNGTVFELSDNEDRSWKDWNPSIPLPSTPDAPTENSKLTELLSK